MADADELSFREILSQSASDTSLSPKNASLIKAGLKVVRGPDWKWDDQDGGEGHVGTIVVAGRSDGALSKQAFVIWNNGVRGNYRTGYCNAYDLRTLDNGSIGVRHPGIRCDSCNQKSMIGLRWKCKLCYDYDLCTRCYMSDKHDITHPFLRIQTYNANRIEIPKRQGSVKILIRNIVSSAKVAGRQSLNLETQNEGSSNSGVDISEGDDNTYWNASSVTWAHEFSNMYPLENQEKNDLKQTEDTIHGYYYRDHLPITGDEARVVKEETFGKTGVKENNEKSFIHLGQDLESLYHSGNFCDFTIKVENREFAIHKAILAARSSVFSSMFQHDMKEKITNTVDIHDCDPSIFEDFLLYLYSGKADRISSSNLTGLYDAAEKYNVQCLKNDCVEFLKANLSADIICDVLALSVKYADEELMKYATDFFILNVSKILLTTKWQDFVKENPVLANELYIKSLRLKQ